MCVTRLSGLKVVVKVGVSPQLVHASKDSLTAVHAFFFISVIDRGAPHFSETVFEWIHTHPTPSTPPTPNCGALRKGKLVKNPQPRESSLYSAVGVEAFGKKIPYDLHSAVELLMCGSIG